MLKRFRRFLKRVRRTRDNFCDLLDKNEISKRNSRSGQNSTFFHEGNFWTFRIWTNFRVGKIKLNDTNTGNFGWNESGKNYLLYLFLCSPGLSSFHNLLQAMSALPCTYKRIFCLIKFHNFSIPQHKT